MMAVGCGAHAARPPAMLTECRLRACTFHEAIVELRVLANQARDPVAKIKLLE
jgi:hypothetical protein